MTASRSKLSWSDLAGARAGVWGLGREGHANLRKLLALGAEPVLSTTGRPARWTAARCSPPATEASLPWSAATSW